VLSPLKMVAHCLKALLEVFGPVPTEAFQGLDDWKTGGFDPPGNGALLTGRDFALKEPTQVVEMAPVVGGAFDSQGLAVFFDRSQLEVIKVLIKQEVGRISSHGLGTMGICTTTASSFSEKKIR
jgi:hypothetical protein